MVVLKAVLEKSGYLPDFPDSTKNGRSSKLGSRSAVQVHGEEEPHCAQEEAGLVNGGEAPPNSRSSLAMAAVALWLHC